MDKEFHILNGDALKEQFPSGIEGEILVARECLVEGNVAGDSLDEFYANRSQFLQEAYGIEPKEYENGTVSEFNKILSIRDSELNLWFEDDLFCQVNFWFVCHLLHESNAENRVYLIRPEVHSQYGFAALDSKGLLTAFRQRTELKDLQVFSNLWKAYKVEDTSAMLELAESRTKENPYVLAAVKAHIDRIPKDGDLGRPVNSLKAIMKELNTNEFAPVYREFNSRESIYGFGDLQVKRLFDQIKQD